MTIKTEFLRSVEWVGRSIKLLDQTKLPLTVEYIYLLTIEDVWESIHSLKVRGAPAIGITAAFGLALWAKSYDGLNMEEFLKRLKKQRYYLSSSRPTAVNLFWALDRMVASVEGVKTVIEAKGTLLSEAFSIQKEDEEICKRIGEYGIELFKDGDTILTHCNAGGIATAKYGTALAPFYIGKEKGVSLSVYATETRPLLQGGRLTVWELQNAGVDVTLITDNMVAHTIQTKNVQAIIVGADRVAANGDTANKIGTLGLAILAKEYGIPFYVAAPLSTVDLDIRTGEDIPIEQRHASEVTHIYGQQIAPEGIKVFNPAFDVTPSKYITAIITESGVLTNKFEEELRRVKKFAN
ncbi:methylthioribose-1-phosphate isomerase [Bacillus coahuilensis p1.1.43]|uniref:Methylthioribose-1-phosphate isomerase n=1 Tax=Bacillus coahuilensis p1.1.43 TaxID=1150625 RepID=A0A147KAQ1_9BACI|nr:S-methyl-5-thioribose-1-phosphate isomerase [Bacillus coahuilensis]KUP07858.1 methylthioribose-1-phosphate isomerase [Bacillus coahuilensis p1.1.43]